MLQSILTPRRASFAALLPLTLLCAACSSDSEPTVDDGSSTGASSPGGATASGGGSSTGGGSASGGEGGSGGEEGTGGAMDRLGPAPVVLGTAENYAIIAESAISNVPTSAITGDLALSPAAASYITGFSLTKAGVNWTSPQVEGFIFAADNDPPTPSALTTAIADMELAYTDAAGRPTPEFLNEADGALGGLTLEPGLYKWNSSVTVPDDLTFAGSANDTWIFQINGDLQVSAAKLIVLSGGARPQNIVWQVTGTVEFGAASHVEGIVLAKTDITLGAGASIKGRLFSQTAVNLATATVTAP